MKKAERQAVFDKFNGKCAYCGCDLIKGWHVDHLQPVWRSSKYLLGDNGKRIYNHEKGEYKIEKYLTHPDRDCIDNYNPACASCNIQKGGNDLEGFRKSIHQFINSLNSYHNQYKFAKRYGLVVETGIDVKFYFETL